MALSDVYNLLTIPLVDETYSVPRSEQVLDIIKNLLGDAASIGKKEGGDEVDFATAVPVEKRIQIVRDAIAAECTVDVDVVDQHFAYFLSLPDTDQPGLYKALTGDEIFSSNFLISDYAADFAAFWKVLALSEWLALTPEQMETIALCAPLTGWLNPTELTSGTGINPSFLSLASLYYHNDLNKVRFAPENDLYSATKQIALDSIAAGGLTFEDFATQISALCSWDESEVSRLMGNDGFAFGDWAKFFANAGFLKLEKAMSMAETTGIDQTSIWSFRDPNKVENIRTALEAKYEESKWFEVSGRIHDPLREKQRDALLGYLIPRVSAIFQTRFDAYDVYAFYLIDPEMSSCFDTSRIKQAISSVQQYIQRILLNLEGTLAIDDDSVKQWEWRKNYCVWEANQKVFIFPENWLEPEFRDNKTELFETLERATSG